MALYDKLINEFCLPVKSSLIDFFRRLEEKKVRSLIVIDESGYLIGTISEGDIRRGRLNGIETDVIDDYLNRFPIKKNVNEDVSALYKFDLTKGPVPVVDELGIVVDVIHPSSNSLNPSSELNGLNVIAPSRISIAGGGSDVAYWFSENEGKVLNLAINRYARVSFKIRDDDQIIWASKNLGVKETHCRKKESNDSLVDTVIRKFPGLPGLDIEICCDFDPGTGLGGSSSLVVAMCLGLSTLQGKLLSKKQLVSLAYEIERIDHGISGGWQDHIAAVYGGLISSQFSQRDMEVIKLDISEEFLDLASSSFFLSRIGLNRSSGEIHNKLSHRREQSKPEFERKMRAIVKLVNETMEIVGTSSWDQLGQVIDKGWMLKKTFDAIINPPEVEARYELLKNCGSTGARLVGAGGSGYFLCYVPLGRQLEFLQKTQAANLNIERLGIDQRGARIIGKTYG